MTNEPKIEFYKGTLKGFIWHEESEREMTDITGCLNEAIEALAQCIDNLQGTEFHTEGYEQSLTKLKALREQVPEGLNSVLDTKIEVTKNIAEVLIFHKAATLLAKATEETG